MVKKDDTGRDWLKRLGTLATKEIRGLPITPKAQCARIDAYLDVAGGLGDLWEMQGGGDEAYFRYVTGLMNTARLGILPKLNENFPGYSPRERYLPMLVWAHELINEIYRREITTPGEDGSEEIRKHVHDRYFDFPAKAMVELNHYAPVMRAMLGPHSSAKTSAASATGEAPHQRWDAMTKAWPLCDGYHPDISPQLIEYIRQSGHRLLDQPEAQKESPYIVLNSMRFALMRMDKQAAILRSSFAPSSQGAADMNEALTGSAFTLFEQAFLNFAAPEENTNLLKQAAARHSDAMLHELDSFVTGAAYAKQKSGRK